MAELIPIQFENLLRRIYREYTRTGSIFDLPSRKFYRPSSEADMSVSFCGNAAANPVGPAAGPHTQLAQNIVLSWLVGSRVIELKTVQIKDRLELTRPCIDMATIGYNTEWSQELRLDESLREYVKASMIVEMLRNSFHGSGFSEGVRSDRFQAPEPCDLNLETIFDISVGYDLAGIQSHEIRAWLKTMRDVSAIIEELRQEIPEEFSAYKDIHFKSEIGNSITLSTFHGTPASEIERICEFLLSEMDYHVIIKMNPPMLGKEMLENLLHAALGYTEVEINPKVYDMNITFADAVDVVRRLQSVAARCGKTIGVKFGNTLEVINKGKFLKDKIQYLSGQPLHVLHLALVDEWRKAFGSAFPISFSAGVDANNFSDCVAIGLVPVTVCTDLLRPGGYGRLPQYLINLERRMNAVGAKTISDFIVRSHEETGKSPIANPNSQLLSNSILHNTSELLKSTIENPRYHSRNNQKPPRKIGSHLHLWDCINCDKCIPVCPNDAVFFFEVEPVEFEFRNVKIVNGEWSEVGPDVFRVRESHQIATFADACNECGNCDVFCPEDGGPYIEKPRFFGSLEAWRKWKDLSGFFLARENGKPVLYGRFKDKEYVLRLNEESHDASFHVDDVTVKLDWESQRILNVTHSHDSEGKVIEMAYYFTMVSLIKGMLNSNRVHFVNVGLLHGGELHA